MRHTDHVSGAGARQDEQYLVFFDRFVPGPHERRVVPYLLVRQFPVGVLLLSHDICPKGPAAVIERRSVVETRALSLDCDTGRALSSRLGARLAKKKFPAPSRATILSSHAFFLRTERYLQQGIWRRRRRPTSAKVVPLSVLHLSMC